MKKILITGSAGLIGSEAALHWLSLGVKVYGIDNNSRMDFFGPKGDVSSVIRDLSTFSNYSHYNVDIRNREDVKSTIKIVNPDVVIHCAAQPSHDKAASIPFDDFDTNAAGTINLLEAARNLDNPDLVFIHMSTNKVYGDTPNYLDLTESDTRYDFNDKKYLNGIDETMSIDNCMHSLFGASKVSADIYVQEYGKYFGMNTGVFRGGCLTGSRHAGVELHGFLSYIVKCATNEIPYTIFGYKGKQVRDQIHSLDVISAFEAFIENPRKGEVYNIGGGKDNAASVLEIINILKTNHNLELRFTLSDENRAGDHICYYTDMKKFKDHFPSWNIKWSIERIISNIVKTELENK